MSTWWIGTDRLGPVGLGGNTYTIAMPERLNDGTPDYYWVSSDPQSNTSIDPATGTLSIVGSYTGTDALSYDIVVSASNASGSVSPYNQTIGVSQAAGAWYAGTPSPVLIGGDTATVWGVGGMYMYSNASIDGVTGTLDVTGNYRGATYEIDFACSNEFGLVGTDVLTVTEPAAQPPSSTQNPLGLATLSNNTIAYGLSNHFVDPQGSTVSYWIAASPLSNATVSPGGVLTVAGAYLASSNVTYAVVVGASNVYAMSNTDTLTVTAAATQAPAATPALGAADLSNEMGRSTHV